MFVGWATFLLREVAMKQRQWNKVAFLVWALVLAVAGIRLGWLYAQEAPSKPAVSEAEKEPAAPKGSTSEGASVVDELALEESKIADKYARLEQVMLKMADLEEGTNPRRAALLRRAVEQSKEKLTKTELESVVKLLNQKQLKRAVDGQSAVQSDLKALLELLMSEDRGDRLKSEQARIKEYIKDLEKMIRIQKALQAKTEGDANAKGLSKEQGDLAQRAEELAKKIKKNEEGDTQDGSADNKEGDKSDDGKKGEKQPGDNATDPMKGDKNGEGSDKKGDDGKKSEGKNSEGKDSEGKDAEGKTGEKSGDKSGDKKGEQGKNDKSKSPEDKSGDKGEDKKGDEKSKDGEKGKEGEKSEPSDSSKSPDSKSKEGKSGKSSKSKSKSGQPKDGQPKEGEPGDDQQQDQPQQDEQSQNPARKRIEQAEQKMRDAQKKLEEAKRKESVEDQREAKEQLEKAKAELEEILRQMREEEVARTLAALEARFKKMLEMQLKVYESTRRMDQVSEESRGETFVVQSAKLGIDERKIAVEAQKALTLLKEEGSSVAFPATVDQMHEDMESVATRLADTKVDDITIGYEEDIIAALEEMIDSLQKAQQDMEKKKQQQQQQQQQQQDQPLVDEIAELKMIKSLQERVNKRTTRYARLLQDDQDPVGQADAAELVDALKKLSQRQQEVYRITRDLVLGKNK